MRKLVIGTLVGWTLVSLSACGGGDDSTGLGGSGGATKDGGSDASGGLGGGGTGGGGTGGGGTGGIGGGGTGGGGTGGVAGATGGTAGQAGSAGASGSAGQAGAGGGTAGAGGTAGSAGGGGTAGSAGSSGSAGTGGIVDAGWDATGSSNSCCGPATTPGCNDPSIEQCVCSKDGACCYSAWDAICVNEVKKYNCNGCLCIDKCSGAGATKCVGDEVQECAMQSTGCLDWQTDTVCPTGEVCMDGSAGAACAPPPPSAENCSEAFPLQSGTNSIAWTASVADYLTSPTSCQPSFANLDGPDLVLKYVPATTSTVTMSFAKPTDTRWVAIVSDAACGTTTETACASEWAASTMDLTFLGTAGTTYYIYVRDTDSGTSPLDNPLGVTVTET